LTFWQKYPDLILKRNVKTLQDSSMLALTIRFYFSLAAIASETASRN